MGAVDQPCASSSCGSEIVAISPNVGRAGLVQRVMASRRARRPRMTQIRRRDQLHRPVGVRLVDQASEGSQVVEWRSRPETRAAGRRPMPCGSAPQSADAHAEPVEAGLPVWIAVSQAWAATYPSARRNGDVAVALEAARRRRGRARRRTSPAAVRRRAGCATSRRRICFHGVQVSLVEFGGCEQSPAPITNGFASRMSFRSTSRPLPSRRAEHLSSPAVGRSPCSRHGWY